MVRRYPDQWNQETTPNGRVIKTKGTYFRVAGKPSSC